MRPLPVQNAIYLAGLVSGVGVGVFLIFLVTKLPYFGIPEEPRLILGIVGFVLWGLGGALTFNLKKPGKLRS